MFFFSPAFSSTDDVASLMDNIHERLSLSQMENTPPTVRYLWDDDEKGSNNNKKKKKKKLINNNKQQQKTTNNNTDITQTSTSPSTFRYSSPHHSRAAQ